ncbi:MAG: hypothetical protein QN158_14505, partial [Armatimonadota bacterium]|nr:hypothetical protein [Armatimonadota bacterium]
GRVWQITACDAACSYGVAWLLLAFSAAAAAGFLREILAPRCRRAGWPLRRVLTDGGSEFKGPFEEARASATRAPSPGTRGPTASSSACRPRSCTSTGASSSGALLHQPGRDAAEPRCLHALLQ